MYKSGHDYDYQYDWVLKKQGQKIPEDDFIGQPTKGNIAAAQGKEEEKKAPAKQSNFVEERKENRANIGHQVMNGGMDKRQASATKRRPPPGGTSGGQMNGNNNYGRHTQAAGWAKG